MLTINTLLLLVNSSSGLSQRYCVNIINIITWWCLSWYLRISLVSICCILSLCICSSSVCYCRFYVFLGFYEHLWFYMHLFFWILVGFSIGWLYNSICVIFSNCLLLDYNISCWWLCLGLVQVIRYSLISLRNSLISCNIFYWVNSYSRYSYRCNRMCIYHIILFTHKSIN